MHVFGPLGPIQWLRELIKGPDRHAFREAGGKAGHAVQQFDPEPRDAGVLRQSAFDAGERPLPGASWPPPRRTGWEDDLE